MTKPSGMVALERCLFNAVCRNSFDASSSLYFQELNYDNTQKGHSNSRDFLLIMGKKNLCERAKNGELHKNTREFVRLVKKGKYLCSECGRIAVDKKDVCKAVKISKIMDSD